MLDMENMISEMLNGSIRVNIFTLFLILRKKHSLSMRLIGGQRGIYLFFCVFRLFVFNRCPQIEEISSLVCWEFILL